MVAKLLIATVLAPLLVAFGGSLWIVCGWALNMSPLWPAPAMTVSEAAALGNAGEAVRLIAIEQHDPNRAWPVREGLLGPAQRVTPLEAAVAIRRASLVRVLLHYGAVVPDRSPARTALICRAAAEASDVAAVLLEAGDRSDPRGECPEPIN